MRCLRLYKNKTKNKGRDALLVQRAALSDDKGESERERQSVCDLELRPKWLALSMARAGSKVESKKLIVLLILALLNKVILFRTASL